MTIGTKLSFMVPDPRGEGIYATIETLSGKVLLTVLHQDQNGDQYLLTSEPTDSDESAISAINGFAVATNTAAEKVRIRRLPAARQRPALADAEPSP